MKPTRLNKFIYVWLLALIVLAPLPYGTVETWSITAWELAIFGGTVLWALQMARSPTATLTLPALAFPLLGLLFLALTQWGVGWSLDPYATRQAIIKLFAYLLFFLLWCAFVQGDTRQRTAIKVMLVTCTVIALIALAQSYGGKFLWQRGTLGPFVNRNHFAGFLEMGLGLAGGLLICRSGKKEWLAVYASAALILIAGIVMSASRGGLLALVAEIVFLVVIALPGQAAADYGRQSSATAAGGKLWLRLAGSLVLALAAIVGSILLVGSEGLLDNLARTQQDAQTSQTLASELPSLDLYNRRDIWQATWQMVQAHPLTGVGLGAFPLAYTRYDPSSGTQRVEQAHNDYLQILADTGWLGGLCALSFLLLLFIQGLRAAQTRDRHQRALITGALAGCFAIAVHSVVDFNLQVTANAQLFLALCAIATNRSARES